MSQIANTKGPLGQKQPSKPTARKPMRRKSAKREPTSDRMFVSDTLRKFARGKECQMKSEWCNGDWETTVLCHSRRRTGTGMAQKPHDFWAYHGCSACHAYEHLIEDRELYDAIRRTQWAVYARFGSLTPDDLSQQMQGDA